MLISAALALACFQDPFDAPRLLLPPAGAPGDAGRAHHAGDFDGDGRVDLLRLVPFSSTTLRFELLRQAPDGSLLAPVSTDLPVFGVAALNAGAGAETADFNADGRADLAVSVFDAGVRTLQLFFGAPDGSFLPDAVFTTTSAGFAFTTGEFNGQVGAELALVESPNTFTTAVRVLEWGPDGLQTLAAADPISQAGASGILAVDVDGDSDLDLVVDAGATFVFRQVAGQFPNFSGVVDSIPNNSIEGAQLLSADVDGDGDADLVNVLPNELQVLRNAGNGALTAEPVQALPNSPLFAFSSSSSVLLTAFDRDGDGRTELIGRLESRPPFATFGGNPTVAEIHFDANAVLERVAWLPDASSEAPIGAVDFDGNGSTDWLGGRTLVRGELVFPERFAEFEPDLVERRLLDLDLDGDLDVFAEFVPFLVSQGWARTNDGAGRFAESPLLSLGSTPIGLERAGYALGDLDANGRPDYLFAEVVPPASLFDPYVELGWRRLELQPGGGFIDLGALTATNALFAGGDLRRGRLIDVDGDGHVDLAPGLQEYFPGDGTGALGGLVTTLDGGFLIDAADFDGDGDFDQLTDLGSLNLVLNGAIGAGSVQVLDSAASVDSRFMDLDRDGDLDVVAPSEGGLLVFENTGGGLAVPGGSPLGLLAGSHALALEDVNGNGLDDLLVVASPAGPAVPSVLQIALRQAGPLAFDEFESFQAWPNMALGDADGDGDLDLAGAALFEGRAADAKAGGWMQYGAPFAGTDGLAPLLGATGPLSPGSLTGSLRVVGARGGTLGYLAVGASQALLVDQPLAGLTQYYDGLLNLVQVPLGGSLAEPGSGAWEYVFPDLAPFAGAVRYCQMFVVDPGAPSLLAATNGLRVEFGL